MKKNNNKEFKQGLALSKGKIKRKSSFDPIKVEQGVNQIHKTTTSNDKSSGPEKEPIVKTTVLVPKSLHRKLKHRTTDLETSISQYFISLLKKDLERHKRR